MSHQALKDALAEAGAPMPTSVGWHIDSASNVAPVPASLSAASGLGRSVCPVMVFFVFFSGYIGIINMVMTYILCAGGGAS